MSNCGADAFLSSFLFHCWPMIIYISHAFRSYSSVPSPCFRSCIVRLVLSRPSRSHDLGNKSSAMPDTRSPATTSDHEEHVEPDQYDDYMDDQREFRSSYGPGKLHPLRFGDLFSGSRYKVIRKLGAGSFSTVWLARDRKQEIFCLPMHIG